MKIKLLFLFLFFTILQLKTFAIDIVYPKNNGVNVYANSTFFVGNSNFENNLFLNGEQVEVYTNGAFLKYVPLVDGENIFFFEEKDKETGELISSLDFRVNKIEPPLKCVDDNNAIICNEKIFLTQIKQDNVPLREKSSENAKRLSHLDKNTILILDWQHNGFWRVILDEGKYAWVNSKHILEPVEIENKLLTKIDDIKFGQDEKEYMFIYKTKFPVPYIIEEEENSLTLKFYNVDVSDYKKIQKYNFTLEPTKKNVLSTCIKLDKKVFGYDVKYENEYMMFKVKKIPEIKQTKPLKNIKIVIDAGHGGKDSGSVGPTRVKESEVNLDVALKLEKVLKKAGADVFMIRDKDIFVDLYERVKLTKEFEPDLFISLHANALPDGANPEEKHGTAVFYYYPQSKQFAKIMQAQILEEMQTKDDGVSKYSLVVIRNTCCPSILIEMAYMVHPQEYTFLLDENFRNSMAEAIKNGIEKFLLENNF